MSDLVLAGAVALIVGGVAAVALRLRERKHRVLRDEALATRARLHAGLGTGGVSVLAVGRDGEIVWFEGGQLPGASLGRAALLGRSAWSAFHEWPGIVAAIRSALAGGRGVDRVTIGASALDVSYAPRFDDAGVVSEAVAVVRDVTVEQTEAQRATRLAEVRSRILAVMGYRLRGQLNEIAGATQLAATLDVQRAPDWLAGIDDASRRMLSYVDHLVDFLELDAGRMTPSVRPFSLRDLIDVVTAAHRQRAAVDGTTFIVRYPRHLPDEFEGDAERLGEALDLLLSVALGTNHGGQVLLNVDVAAAEAGFAGVVISVEDDGRGLSIEARARVFDAFDSASAMWASRSGSSGLELPLAQRLATMLGGSLEIDSEPGVGTALRLATRMARAWGRRGAPAPLDDGASVPGALLLVDDDARQRATTRAFAQALGWTVVEAGHGGEALRLIEGGAPVDGVVTELHMPVCDGFGLIDALRGGHASSPRLPVVVLTADARPESRDRALRLGAAGFAVKPLGLDALTTTLRALRPSEAGSLPGAHSPLDGSLARLRDLDPEEGPAVVGELVRAILEALPVEMVRLGDAVREVDRSTIESVVASLQVSSRLVGAPRLTAALVGLMAVPPTEELAVRAALDAVASEAHALRIALLDLHVEADQVTQPLVALAA